MIKPTLPVFIGYDSRDPLSYEVTKYSLERHSSIPLHVKKLNRGKLECAGFYDRPYQREGNQYYDARDGKPFSTEFSFTRFLVPGLCLYDGWALFCDGDFLLRADISDLFALADERFAAMVVKHEHDPREWRKMDGIMQSKYRRKNWSSLILWNCGHKSNLALTAGGVNHNAGSWLHAFSWLEDHEIGSLPPEWNCLVGIDQPNSETKALHYTLGTPEFEAKRNGPYADAWIAELRLCQSALEKAA